MNNGNNYKAMNREQQIDIFQQELAKMVHRFRSEFELDLHTIVGVLEDEKMELLLGGGVGFESEIDLEDEEE